MPRAFTIEEVRRIVSDTSNCELLSTEYTGVYDKLRFRCACGKEFEKSWNHFRYDRVKACPACARALTAQSRRLSEAEVKHLLESFGCEYLGGYVNRRQPMRVRYRCGHEGEVRLNTVLHEGFCGECWSCVHTGVHRANRLLRDAVAEKCEALGVELVSETYENAKTPIQLRCLCGTVFTTTWDIVKQSGKTRCDACSGLQSVGARSIERWLTERGIRFVKEKTFAGCLSAKRRRLRFDFYLPTENLCIEFDGQQHFKPVAFGGFATGGGEDALLLAQENDAIKDRWCEEHNIGLLRIRYDDVARIPEILCCKLIPR